MKIDIILEIKNIIQSEKLNIDTTLNDQQIILEFEDKVDWEGISEYQKLSEDFIREFKDNVYWNLISEYQKLSEDFIREFKDKVDWYRISKHQKLSEDFIREFQDQVDWFRISQCQKMSENFIREFQDKVHWTWISQCQKMSEDFIREFQDQVDWGFISKYQKLSENFIREFQDQVDWFRISIYQKLSENFIREFKDKVDWSKISKYQKLSEEFRKEFNLEIPKNNMYYFSREQKMEILNNDEGNHYEMDGDYILAYKSTRFDGYSTYNFQYQYKVGQVYESHADGNLNEENSFGLSVWTKEGALDYKSDGELYRVKIHIDDVVAIVHEKKKLRCTKIEIIEKVTF